MKGEYLREEIPAGEFSSWLRETVEIRERETISADVPCGDCTGCCRSSMFIHIRPEEARTLARIPKELLFPAPGQPEGHVLMGYNERGECPMLVQNKCAIYEDRPRTCREYDCRVFAATGLSPDPSIQPVIAERVRSWKFEITGEEGRMELEAVRACATFLRDHSELFPPGALPRNPVQLADLAILVFRVHRNLEESIAAHGRAPSPVVIASVLLREIKKIKGGP